MFEVILIFTILDLAYRHGWFKARLQDLAVMVGSCEVKPHRDSQDFLSLIRTDTSPFVRESLLVQ